MAARDGSKRRAAMNGKAVDGQRLMSIGELARMTGVSRRTIRYYEELGIVPEPPRSPGGTRKYPEEYRFYIEGALSLKQVGFNLDEVRLIGRLALGARLSAGDRNRAVRAIAEKRQNLEHKIRVLNKMHELLQQQESRARTPNGDGRAAAPSQRFAELLGG